MCYKGRTGDGKTFERWDLATDPIRLIDARTRATVRWRRHGNDEDDADDDDDGDEEEEEEDEHASSTSSGKWCAAPVTSRCVDDALDGASTSAAKLVALSLAWAQRQHGGDVRS
jgi:hypothetical protein